MESFGKYLLLEKIASGGMAEVYLSKLTGANGINKFVAIKRILPQYTDNADFVDMFKEEAKIAVNLSHSNIVSIYDFGIERSQFFLVMEFVEGQNLRQILNHIKREGRDLALDQIVYIVKEVAAGLDHAHRCLDGTTGRPLNITHRDMSPQNVMLSFEGEIKIVDFGIAKAETQAEQTRAGTIKGKFGYMSPEQADGHTVDPRTDIFSLGIVLWELLAKDRLFTGQNEAATLRKVRECQVPSLRKINPSIPPELERICMKALAKDKSLRYQTAAAFHKDLNRFLNTQFPEFSTQEFSKFMKSLYHKMYLENRRKLADYAKVVAPAPNEAVNQTVTSTMTSTIDDNLSHSGLLPEAPGRVDTEIDVSSHSQQIDLSAMKAAENNLKAGGAATNTRSQTFRSQAGAPRNQTMSGVVRTGTQTGIRSGTQSRIQRKPNSSSSWIPRAIGLVVLVGLMYLVYQKKFAGGEHHLPTNFSQQGDRPSTAGTQPQQAQTPPTGQIDSSSKQLVPLNIQSRPQGAMVFINGANVGITPFIGHYESSTEFKLVLRKDGFLPYERPTEKAQAPLYRIEAALQPEPPMGYISIEVIGGGVDPIVTVNGQRVDDKTQWNRYPIPAGVPVKIRAMNPFAQVSGEETVTVGQSQKKAVRLILSRQGNDTGN